MDKTCRKMEIVTIVRTNWAECYECSVFLTKNITNKSVEQRDRGDDP
jgi:hypothetical protein